LSHPAPVRSGKVEVLVGDGAELELGSGYDRVFVDARCSGHGTIASRPDLGRRQAADALMRDPGLGDRDRSDGFLISALDRAT
jgi:hypothetical protein